MKSIVKYAALEQVDMQNEKSFLIFTRIEKHFAIINMLVRDLIKHLSKLDPQMRILVEGYEQGFDDPRKIFKAKVFPSFTTKYYNGDYNEISDAEETDKALVFEAYVIPGKPRKG